MSGPLWLVRERVPPNQRMTLNCRGGIGDATIPKPQLQGNARGIAFGSFPDGGAGGIPIGPHLGGIGGVATEESQGGIGGVTGAEAVEKAFPLALATRGCLFLFHLLSQSTSCRGPSR
jgi:hypothetical protein